MTISRRRLLNLMAAGSGVGLLGPFFQYRSFAQAGRTLNITLQGFSLAIHVPELIAIHEELPKLGYNVPKIDRVESMQVITQTVVSGSTEIGDADVVSTLRASEAGADLRLIGLVYNNTSQVLVVNADKVKTYEDLRNRDNAIALNSRGDFIYVILSGILARHNIDINETTIVEIGGSGSRMRALLGGRVAAVPVHFEQAEAIIKQGNFKVLIEPWMTYRAWYSQAWLVQGSWLESEANQRAAIDLNKAMITAFRRANEDYGYFAAGFRKYATVKDAANVRDEELIPIWKKLSRDIGAWPNDGGFRRESFKELLPVYREAGAIKSEPDVDRVIDTRFVEQALKELG